jgi:adenylate kinase
LLYERRILILEFIFLAGIHGVGKSTLSDKLKKILDIKSHSVSDLIRRSGKSLDPSIKNTGSISKNQELWKVELNRIDICDSFLLLDGHFCLLDIDENITPLPFSTFEGTHMTKIIFMMNNPQVIRERLLDRDNKDYSIELLEKFQEYEGQQAIKYSEKNNIPLFIYDEDLPFSELLNFITN